MPAENGSCWLTYRFGVSFIHQGMRVACATLRNQGRQTMFTRITRHFCSWCFPTSVADTVGNHQPQRWDSALDFTITKWAWSPASRYTHRLFLKRRAKGGKLLAVQSSNRQRVDWKHKLQERPYLTGKSKVSCDLPLGPWANPLQLSKVLISHSTLNKSLDFNFLPTQMTRLPWEQKLLWIFVVGE